MEWNKENQCPIELKCEEMIDTTSPSLAVESFPLYECQQIYRNMQTKEQFHQPSCESYLKYRRLLVDWTSEVGEEMQLAKQTIYTAVCYLDRLFHKDNQDAMPRDQLQLAALCCIFVSSKYNETNTISLKDLWHYGNRLYTLQAFRNMEIIVLERLGWSLATVTSVDFLEMFVAQGVLWKDDRISHQFITPQTQIYYEKYVWFFADLCLQEFYFQTIPPSLVAATILSIARCALKMLPPWREELSILTKYSVKDIKQHYDMIWDLYVSTFPKHVTQAQSRSPVSVSGIMHM